jgi:hypothetical protein
MKSDYGKPARTGWTPEYDKAWEQGYIPVEYYAGN